jgi:Bifunctional DNA primase/polymerase, N-terminal
MSRPSWLLRDAALGYASRGIPVLPLHYPLLPYHCGVQPVTSDGRLAHPAVGMGCSCRDPSCGQVGKHPLGSMVPHGLKEATTNRARVLAWWTQQPQANIGLATGHRFDVLDVDGPTGAQAIRTLASEHDLQSSGPLVRTGGGGWHYYLAPTGLGNVAPRGLEQVDWRGRGGYVVAPPSRHTSGQPYQWLAGRDLDTALPRVPGPLLERLQRQLDRPAGGVVPLPVGDRPGPRYGQAALAQELARVATAPVGHRNRQLWEAARNLYNLVAAGALDHQQVHHGLLRAAERCGLLGDEPRQTRRTLASGRQVGLAHPRPAPDRTHPDPTHASPPPPTRAGGERTQKGR